MAEPTVSIPVNQLSKNPSDAQLKTEVAKGQEGLLEGLTEFLKKLKINNEEIEKFVINLGSAAGKTAAVKTQLFLLTKGYEVYNSVLSQAAAVQKELDKTSVEFNKTIGDKSKDALDAAIKAFGDFSFELGLTGKEVNDSFLEINKSFALTGLSSDKVAKKIAQNSKVIGSKEMIDYIKTFSLQAKRSMGQTVEDVRKMGDQFVIAARKVGLPNDELLKLSQGLLTSGVAFGRTKEDLQDLTIKSEAFGRALGGSGKLIQEQLGSMRTIQGRLTKSANLQRIAAMVGAEVDPKIMSSDPKEQEEGLKQTFINISEAYKEITDPGQRNAFALAFQSASGLSTTQAQAVLGSDLKGTIAENEKKLEDALKAGREKKEISKDDRIAAATTEQQIEALRAILQQKAAFKQMGVFGAQAKSATDKLKAMNTAIISFAGAVNKAEKQISDALDDVDKKFKILENLERGKLGDAAAGAAKAGGAVVETIGKEIANAIIRILSGMEINTSMGKITLGNTNPNP